MRHEWNQVDRSPYAFDYFLIGISFWWVVIMLFPYGTFSYGTTEYTGDWKLLANVASGSTWGVMLCSSAIVLLASLLYKSKWLYRVAMMSQAMWWVFVSYVIITTAPFSTGTVMYSLIAAMCIYHFFTAHYITPLKEQGQSRKEFGAKQGEAID